MKHIGIILGTLGTTAILFGNIGCRNESVVYKQLITIDSLLYRDFVDSAKNISKSVEPQSQEEFAYYFLLNAEIDYRQHIKPNFKEINLCINYYENNKDYRKLSNAYYYKACALIIRDTLPNEVFTLLKKAEYNAEKTSDIILKSKICSALSYANFAKNQTQESLKYARKEYAYAKIQNNSRDIAYALIRLAMAHNDLGNIDSSQYYILKCKNFANKVNNKDKAYIYNILGVCIADTNPDLSLKYLQTSLKYNKLPETYKNISDIYYAKKDLLNWKKYCDSALADAWFDSKIAILSNISENYYDSKDFENYKLTIDELINTMNNYFKYEKENYTLELQNKFDFEKQQSEYEKNLWIILTILTSICAITIIIAKQKRQNIKQENAKLEKDNITLYTNNKKLQSQIENYNQQIENYNQQIEYLKKQKEELTSDNDNLSSVILSYEAMLLQLETKKNELNNQNTKNLEIGKQIYDIMVQNLSINDYKEKWATCVYYFETTIAINDIFELYFNLNISHKMFIIADDYLKKTDEQLSKIFSISKSTVRSRRTKLKEKLK